jgi:hypothetical protein
MFGEEALCLAAVAAPFRGVDQKFHVSIIADVDTRVRGGTPLLWLFVGSLESAV